jgi:4-aminobutyrate aminotransferase
VYPLVADKARGLWIEDVDGNVFLDFTAGIAVCATGHCHPRVVEAIKEQAERLLHMSGTDFYYTPQITLAEKLTSVVPGAGEKKVFFGNSGAEAVEAAFKLARFHTRRDLNIAFFGAFHGRTMGALSLTASKTIQKKHYHPFVPGITHIPYAYCYRCKYGLSYPACGIECVRWIEETLFRTVMPPEEVAAIFVEPIQGEGGYIVPPLEFHRELFRIARTYGILYVADEVQSGMGRTGKMFACEHENVSPDIMCLAKGITGGYLPLAATLTTTEIYAAFLGEQNKTFFHGHTYTGNPLACAVALANLELFAKENIIAKLQPKIELIRRGLNRFNNLSRVGDVRQKGMMVGIELVEDKATKKPYLPELRMGHQVIMLARKHGLVIRPLGDVIVLMPVLAMGEEELNQLMEITYLSIKEATEN